MKRKYQLRYLIFFALCCDLGMFSKRLVVPIANLITDALHIPGGIGTAFSLMFLVVGASVIPIFGCATLMGAVQSVIALAFGMVGSMGLLSPIGYIVPGIVIDLCLWLGRRHEKNAIFLANTLASLSAALCANLLVFHLYGIVLALYGSVAALSGAVCGCLAESIYIRIKPALRKGLENNETE